jgi:hypothetical protein
MAVTMMSKLLASGPTTGMAERERAVAAPTAASNAHQRRPQRTEQKVPGQPRHLTREMHSAICTGFRHGKTPCSSSQLSSARLSPALHPAQLNACAYSPIKDCVSRSLMAACRIPGIAACDAGCIDPPWASRYLGSDTTVYNKPLHTDSYCRTPAISPCSGFSCRTHRAR